MNKVQGVAKKGLLIGINYTDSEFQLHVCINDCNNLKIF